MTHTHVYAPTRAGLEHESPLPEWEGGEEGHGKQRQAMALHPSQSSHPLPPPTLLSTSCRLRLPRAGPLLMRRRATTAGRLTPVPRPGPSLDPASSPPSRPCPASHAPTSQCPPPHWCLLPPRPLEPPPRLARGFLVRPCHLRPAPPHEPFHTSGTNRPAYESTHTHTYSPTRSWGVDSTAGD